MTPGSVGFFEIHVDDFEGNPFGAWELEK